MYTNQNLLFKQLFDNFFIVSPETQAIIISKLDGSILFAKSREEDNTKKNVYYSSLINPIIDRIRNEFNELGIKYFIAQDYQLYYLLAIEDIVIFLVVNLNSSSDIINAYLYFLAEKVAQIFSSKDDNVIELSIPKFSIDIKNKTESANESHSITLNENENYRYKFIIVGDPGVGKTSIIRRFTENKFTDAYRATIGLNITSYNIEFLRNKIELIIWDIGSQEHFKRIRKLYYQNTQAAFIVFDLTKKESYDNIINWFNELEQFLKVESIPIVILGNKSDLSEDKEIEYQKGVDMTKNISEKGISIISYIETSALTGENIADAFKLLSYHYIIKNKELKEISKIQQMTKSIETILSIKKKLTISFIVEDLEYNPGMESLKKILTKFTLHNTKIEEGSQIYEYLNSLTVKNFNFNKIEISNSDAVFCIFKGKDNIITPLNWKNTILKVLDQLKENNILLIGIQINENIDWSSYIENFSFINNQADNKKITLYFFKFGINYQIEIFEKLNLMFNTIENTS